MAVVMVAAAMVAAMVAAAMVAATAHCRSVVLACAAGLFLRVAAAHRAHPRRCAYAARRPLRWPVASIAAVVLHARSRAAASAVVAAARPSAAAARHSAAAAVRVGRAAGRERPSARHSPAAVQQAHALRQLRAAQWLFSSREAVDLAPPARAAATSVARHPARARGPAPAARAVASAHAAGACQRACVGSPAFDQVFGSEVKFRNLRYGLPFSPQSS